MNSKRAKIENSIEKLGSILRIMGQFEIPEWDKSTLIWIACDYFDELEQIIAEVEIQ